jgi:hypothetical protein
MNRSFRSKLVLLLLSALALLLISPSHLNFYIWEDQGLTLADVPQSIHPIPEAPPTDLDGDGRLEHVLLIEGSASIQRGQKTLWTSPPGWDVTQARISDLNQDGQPELALLLWRDFAPWPIDAWLAYPGRINDFHDQDDRSCHLILIGWRDESFVELWAGSALADPLLSFTTADINVDGDQELITLESRYDGPRDTAHSVTTWEWNGFGFSLLARGPSGRFHALHIANTTSPAPLLILQGIPRR